MGMTTATVKKILFIAGVSLVSLGASAHCDGDLTVEGGLRVGYRNRYQEGFRIGPWFEGSVGCSGLHVSGSIFEAQWNDRTHYTGYHGRNDYTGYDLQRRRQDGIYDQGVHPRGRPYPRPQPVVDVPDTEANPPRRTNQPTPPRGRYTNNNTCENATVKCALSGDFQRTDVTILFTLGGSEHNRGAIVCSEIKDGKVVRTSFPIRFNVETFNLGLSVKNTCMNFRSPNVCDPEGKMTRDQLAAALMGQFQMNASTTHVGPSAYLGPISARAGITFRKVGAQNNLRIGFSASIPDREGCSSSLGLNLLEHVRYVGVSPAGDSCARLPRSCSSQYSPRFNSQDFWEQQNRSSY